MTIKRDNNSSFTESVKKMARQLKPLSKMSLERRVIKLRDFKKRKEIIENELKNVDIAITYLEFMPDLARYQVLKNSLARSLLAELSEKGQITYEELRSYFPKNSSDVDLIIEVTIGLLNRAQLIERAPTDDGLGYTLKIAKNVKVLPVRYGDRKNVR